LAFKPQNNRLLVLSIDADGLDGSVMPAVSAVNADGINKIQMAAILDWYKKISNPTKCLGLYEFNPIYDTLSQVGARYLTSLLYRFIF
jgi:formiminoglutamase